MVTEVDLLAIKVHLAALREQQIRAENELEVMKAELNQTLGEPLDSEFTLLTPLEYREKNRNRRRQLEELMSFGHGESTGGQDEESGSSSPCA